MYYENNEGVCLAIMKRALFIGRWQPLHPGHKWLFNQKLEKNIPILIAVRDTPVNDSNPFSTEEVISNLQEEYRKEVDNEMVKVISIPDIESVNYGRGVGYEINEFVPPKDVGMISATEIRGKMKNNE
jgi:nicotinamide mononucleotide adenylyltransferase